MVYEPMFVFTAPPAPPFDAPFAPETFTAMVVPGRVLVLELAFPPANPEVEFPDIPPTAVALLLDASEKVVVPPELEVLLPPFPHVILYVVFGLRFIPVRILPEPAPPDPPPNNGMFVFTPAPPPPTKTRVAVYVVGV
jgi:hypothetical protein